MPAILRIVSGKKTIMTRRVIDERIRRNMKMDLNPRKFARTPPRTGPMGDAKVSDYPTPVISVVPVLRNGTGELTSLVEADKSSTFSRG